jgi:hypothetical protein
MSDSNEIRYTFYPRTQPPPQYTHEVISVFEDHIDQIGTFELEDGLVSNEVLKTLRPDLVDLGFNVEAGKKKEEKIKRPVFFGERGEPTLKYEVDGYHPDWGCGLEVEAGRAWMGNAVYRDLIQAIVMVQVDVLILAVANVYKHSNGESRDYEKTQSVVEALYSHSRAQMPYGLLLVGY